MPIRAKYWSALVVSAGCSFCQSPPPTWVQLGVDGQIIARQVLAPGQSCAQVQTPGGNLPMNVRGPSPSNFAVTVCEAILPNGTTSASINSVALPLPHPGGPIVVIGDTGCEGDTPGLVGAVPEDDDDDLTPQAGSSKVNCADPSLWPLPQTSKTLAAKGPGVVIHVGDYVYVKAETWNEWKSQFFDPAQPLLSSSPWIFVRGNHETCGRHGPGYFLLLDPRPYAPNVGTGNCLGDATEPYRVAFGGNQFIVLDSSGATCDFAGKACSQSTTIPAAHEQVKTWKRLIATADKAVPAGGSGILLTHRPVWGSKAEKLNSGVTSCPAQNGRGGLALNSTLLASWQKAAPKRFSMVVSGHTHTFEFLTYTKGAAPQLIAGNGGVTLTSPVTSANNCQLATTVSGKPFLRVSTVNGYSSWGYTVLNPGGRALTLLNPSGTPLLSCSFTSTSATCKTPESAMLR